MKNLIAFLALSLFSQHMMAKSDPPIPQSYVYATSGLNLRATAGTDGQILTVIPFGERVTILDDSTAVERIDWLEGKWVQVSYQGTQGYLFSAYLSDLPILNPEEQFLPYTGMNLTLPLIDWINLSFEQSRQADTLVLADNVTISSYYEGGHFLTHNDTEYRHRVHVLLRDKTLGEAYNLLRSFLVTDEERLHYDEHAVFIEQDQIIRKIRIELDVPIQLSPTTDGDVMITVTDYHEVTCSH